ncbi:MAG: hypothetical protein ABIA63_06935, partial [bacterium]
MDPKYLVGIDLHGTLLDDQWEIKDHLKEPLAEKLEHLKDFCGVYVCSGNDLTFIKKYIHPD